MAASGVHPARTDFHITVTRGRFCLAGATGLAGCLRS